MMIADMQTHHSKSTMQTVVKYIRYIITTNNNLKHFLYVVSL